MKRRFIIKLCVFLLLGAVVNVAVAWGCALWLPLPIVFSPTPIDCPDTWPAYLRESWPPPARAEERVGFQQGIGSFGVSIIDISSEEVQASTANPITDASLEVHRFGVPVHSMQWENRGLNAGERSMELLLAAADEAGWRNGLRTSIPTGPNQGSKTRRLPLTTIWPGFAINTLFYAAILWMLFAAPFALRRRRRRKRGLCPACAYPIGTSAVCTECGRAVKGLTT